MVIKKNNLNESSLQNFPLDQANKESCFRMPICKCSFYTSGQPYVIWAEDLLGKVTAICWQFTLSIQRASTYASLSHQLSVHLTHCSCVVCLQERQIREGDNAGIRKRKARKLREEKRAIIQMWLNGVTLTCSALPFIHYHTTPHVRVYTSWL